jgi:hypothetical protein
MVVLSFFIEWRIILWQSLCMRKKVKCQYEIKPMDLSDSFFLFFCSYHLWPIICWLFCLEHVLFYEFRNL